MPSYRRRRNVPPKKEIISEVLDITPEMAEQWLGHNTHNRRVRQIKVVELAEAMKRDEWQLNGDAIRFDVEDKLLDGQHRLCAIVASGVTIKSFVIRNLPAVTQETMDFGTRRKLGDVLQLRGYTNPLVLSAVINGFWRWTNGYVRMPQKVPTVTQAITTLKEYPELVEAAHFAARFNAHFRSTSAPIGASWAVFGSIDSEANEEFWNRLIDGTGLSKTSPIWHLRQFFIQSSSATRARGTRGNAVLTHALLVKAWNCYRNGTQVQTLTWRPTGKGAEGFPEPV